MPRIRWDNLPFKLCGKGSLPETSLLPGQAAKGTAL